MGTLQAQDHQTTPDLNLIVASDSGRTNNARSASLARPHSDSATPAWVDESLLQSLARLLDDGHAYYCFCTPEQLEAERQTALQAGHQPRSLRTLPRYPSRGRGAPAASGRGGGDPANGSRADAGLGRPRPTAT